MGASVQVLFATETFAMGLNMPARAVVFTSLMKFDGVKSRFLTSGEYIQMSGRAGRRGKDDRGYCIMMVEDPDIFTPEVAKLMVSGKPMPLLSSFKLSYYTLLNLMKRLEGGFDRMEYLIRHSFQQFQHEKSMPAWQGRLADIEATLRSGGDGALRSISCWSIDLENFNIYRVRLIFYWHLSCTYLFVSTSTIVPSPSCQFEICRFAFGHAAAMNLQSPRAARRYRCDSIRRTLRTRMLMSQTLFGQQNPARRLEQCFIYVYSSTGTLSEALSKAGHRMQG